MSYPDIADRLDDGTADIAGILDLAAARHAAGRSMRGLPKPAGDDLPEDGYWSLQRRTLQDGTRATYLAWRWREHNRLKARNLGRIDDGRPA